MQSKLTIVSRLVLTALVGMIISTGFFMSFSLAHAQEANTTSSAELEQTISLLLERITELRAEILTRSGINSTVTSASIDVGDRVQSTSNLNVRTLPGRNNPLVGQVPALTMGTVLEGPAKGTLTNTVVPQETVNADSWWKIKYDNGVTGWSSGLYVRDLSSDYGGVPAGTEAVTCDSFAFTPATVAPNGSTTLAWTTSNADRVFLSGGDLNIRVGADSSYEFTPVKNGLYTLTVLGKNNTRATCAATIVVRDSETQSGLEQPICELASFSPTNIKEGEETTASWKVANASQVLMTSTANDNSRRLPIEGEYTFTPESGVTYFLTAVSEDGTQRVSCAATVVVQDVPATETTPICNAFYFTPSTVARGDTVTAAWETTNSRRVVFKDINNNVLREQEVDGTYSFKADKSSIYTLFVYGSDGTRNSCTASLVVTR